MNSYRSITGDTEIILRILRILPVRATHGVLPLLRPGLAELFIRTVSYWAMPYKVFHMGISIPCAVCYHPYTYSGTVKVARWAFIVVSID